MNNLLESTNLEYLREKIMAEFVDEETIFKTFGKRMSINNYNILLLCSFIRFYEVSGWLTRLQKDINIQLIE